MDGFSYSNIFETKGIEYLAIIAFFIILVPFWLILNKKVKITRKIQEVYSNIKSGISNVPRGIFHGNNHTWAFLEKSGVASIGLDKLLAHLTGNVQLKIAKQSGEQIRKGELLTEIEQNGKILQIYSPISGTIEAFNTEINSPEFLQKDIYAEGWICKIKPTNWKSDTTSLHLGDEAAQWMQSEMNRVKDFVNQSITKLSPDPAIILQDGGELSENTLSFLPKEIWDDFQTEFLNQK